MEATETNWLASVVTEAQQAITECKRLNLREPLPVETLSKEQRRRLCRRFIVGSPEAKELVQVLLIREMLEALQDKQSGLDRKLERYAKSLRRKLR